MADNNSTKYIIDNVKITIKIVGSLFVIIGLLFSFLNLSFMLTGQREEGTIEEILERKKGTNYIATSVGSESPCRLKVYIPTIQQSLPTTGEMDPCTRFIGKYYKVGDKITVYRIEKMVEVANWFSGMVVPLSVSMLGIYLLTLKKLPIIKRSK